MCRTLLALAALCTILSAHPALAQTVVLKPSSPWNVDLAENKCRMTRFFGDDSSRHVLIYEQYWPGEKPGIYVAGPAFAALDRSKPFALSFSEGQPVITREPYKGSFEGYGVSYFYPELDLSGSGPQFAYPAPVMNRFPGLDTDMASRFRFVALRFGEAEVRLETGPMQSAFTVLNECAQNIMLKWGFDLERQLTASRMPYWVNEAAMAKHISQHIPFEKMGSAKMGVVRLRLFISETGAVAECKVIEAPDVRLLDRPICRGMRRAKFEPARDQGGNPMPSFYATTIVYAIG